MKIPVDVVPAVPMRLEMKNDVQIGGPNKNEEWLDVEQTLRKLLDIPDA